MTTLRIKGDLYAARDAASAKHAAKRRYKRSRYAAIDAHTAHGNGVSSGHTAALNVVGSDRRIGGINARLQATEKETDTAKPRPPAPDARPGRLSTAPMPKAFPKAPPKTHTLRGQRGEEPDRREFFARQIAILAGEIAE